VQDSDEYALYVVKVAKNVDATQTLSRVPKPAQEVPVQDRIEKDPLLRRPPLPRIPEKLRQSPGAQFPGGDARLPRLHGRDQRIRARLERLLPDCENAEHAPAGQVQELDAARDRAVPPDAQGHAETCAGLDHLHPTPSQLCNFPHSLLLPADLPVAPLLELAAKIRVQRERLEGPPLAQPPPLPLRPGPAGQAGAAQAVRGVGLSLGHDRERRAAPRGADPQVQRAVHVRALPLDLLEAAARGELGGVAAGRLFVLQRHLLKVHDLHTGWFRRTRLSERAVILKAMDNAILREGGVHNMPAEALRNACLIRGLNPANMRNEDMISWLNNWIAISSAVDKENLSLLLHCPILLAYNEPSNWSLIYKDKS
jgi:hypothetical protein